MNTAPPPTANTAVQAAIRPDYSPEQRAHWLTCHEKFVRLARQGGVNVVFFGDSLTDYWRERGRSRWDRYFAPLQAVNFGIGGDRTQQVLWRIEHGELEGITPKVVVLLIGSNNLTPGLSENSLTSKNSPTETVAGVAAIIAGLRRRLPQSRLLLHAILPRAEPTDPIRRAISETNAGLARLADGRMVRFVDLGGVFLSPDGTLSREIMPDLLHLSARGYAIWAAALQAPLNLKTAVRR